MGSDQKQGVSFDIGLAHPVTKVCERIWRRFCSVAKCNTLFPTTWPCWMLQMYCRRCWFIRLEKAISEYF